MRVGREAMAHDVQKLERMIEAVPTVSRACACLLTTLLLSIDDLLHGQIVVSDAELAEAIVALYPRCVTELLTMLTDDRPAEVRLQVGSDEVLLSIALPSSAAAFTGYPVHALLTSLQQHSGTAVVALASTQAQLERQGGALLCNGGPVYLRIPLVLRQAPPDRAARRSGGGATRSPRRCRRS